MWRLGWVRPCVTKICIDANFRQTNLRRRPLREGEMIDSPAPLAGTLPGGGPAPPCAPAPQHPCPGRGGGESLRLARQGPRTALGEVSSPSPSNPPPIAAVSHACHAPARSRISCPPAGPIVSRASQAGFPGGPEPGPGEGREPFTRSARRWTAPHPRESPPLGSRAERRPAVSPRRIPRGCTCG